MKDYTQTCIEQLQKQDAAAFGQVYDEYVDIFFRYIKANFSINDHDAQDLLSDIFVKIRQALPTIKKDGSPSGFFWTIAKNHIKDYFKRNNEILFSQMNINNDTEQDLVREDTLQDPEVLITSYNTSYTYEVIQQTINTLEEIYKDPLLLKFIEELSYEDIAKTLGISQDSVRQRVSRGLKKLQESLKNIQ